jgi:uncharacterized protein
MLPILMLLLAAISLPAKPNHYVTDRPGVLSTNRANALNEKLAEFERKTSDQILVYIDRKLPPDTTIEEMGSEAIRKWGVGQKGKDNGAILFVFIGDRKIRIEVGYGLEGSLTDAKSKWITSTVMKPAFQRGDYPAGIEQGVDAMLATIRGEAYRGSGTTVTKTVRRPTNNAALIWDLVRWTFGLLWWAAVFHFLYHRIRYGKSPKWSQGWSSGSSSSWTASSSGSSWSSDSSSSSSSSSSSFEGGGGSGGGGGASDSW